MSSAGKRERSLPLLGKTVVSNIHEGGDIEFKDTVLANGKQITVSESHPRNPRTGSFNAGGPFYTSRVTYFSKPGSVKKAYYRARDSFYTGPIMNAFPTSAEMTSIGFKNPSKAYGAENKASMLVDGTNAISRSNPVNPASNLGTSLAEISREGLPSIPGIQLWKRKTEAAKAAGSEYLNYVFGWAPVTDEVHSVVNAARHHRDIMNQYHKGEGKNTHRRYDYPLQVSRATISGGTEVPIQSGIHPSFFDFSPAPQRTVSLYRETKRWFEGCFTYALPSSTDSWRKAVGFGSQADQLFGLTLTPSLLWELTPWSWAVDWFSNAGEVINNVTNFGLAGLVLRYGYTMEESIERITAETGAASFFSSDKHFGANLRTSSGPCSSGFEIVTKRRYPASPFGFSVGWEGLSPTQLAITAALGITRLL
jgi:hypothetical protein